MKSLNIDFQHHPSMSVTLTRLPQTTSLQLISHTH